MAQDPKDKAPPPLPPSESSFFFDHDRTGSMPSISRLLNRKSAQISKNYKEIGPTVRAAKRRTSPPSQIAGWTLAMLEGNSDPLAHGLLDLLKAGASGALFMSISAPEPGSAAPTFLASAGISLGQEPQQQLALWTGLKWRPSLLPQTWNQFVQTGSVEIPPNPNQEEFVTTRQALGVPPGIILTLLRCGPEQACRGMLAIFSSQSIRKDTFAESSLRISA